ncbi:MAG: T9SS type A sorting domain-containing protein [Ignavibacteriae bacterium]|nr:T9SS type A sorting domain-containing protein [Ignavibacteria bacterium]MBI3363915.1 T9SS type A sorting domain-containing protein [Ignavibacteriota bacterium]
MGGILLLAMGLLGPLVFGAAPSEKGKTSAQRTVQNVMGRPASSLMNINNIAMWVKDDGGMERNPATTNAGTTYPRGTSTFVYAGGLIWGGIVEDGGAPKLRVGGQTYNYGTVPGRIVSKGVKESADNPDVRIYRIRRDWKTADLGQDAAEFFDKPLSQVTADDIGSIRSQYKKDWLEWPWRKGAPYYDRDGNGQYNPDPSGNYDPHQDEPGLGGADQVIWLVANDLDASATRGLYGSPPVGIEMQVTLWGYARSDELGNVIYERYRIIYKGTATSPPNARIDSMYLCKWVDPDEGDYGDDYAGCVFEKSLGYDYNSSPTDAEYKKFDLSGGANGGPPVVGYDFFQGPRIISAGSKARWDLRILDGYANLPMTTFGYFAAGGHDSDPDLSNYEGTKQWYNLLRGYRPRPVDPPQCFFDPTIQQCTHYELSGDPTTLRGWIDGRVDPPSDRRILLASGPISMVLGDTQEVVVGLIGAIGKDNIDGINVLKATDDVAQDAFNLNFELPDPVPSPPLRIVELNNKLILDWESDTAQVSKIEQYNSKGYRFETYNIYQLPSASATASQAKLLPPFDVTTPRSLAITKDKLRSRPLVNGQKYYYAITAVVYNPDPALVKKRLESPLLIKIAIPHSPNPGTVYPYVENTALSGIENFSGVDDAIIRFTYFDPSRPDGHTYKIPFTKIGRDFKWDFIDFGTDISPVQDTLLRKMNLNSSTRYSDRGFTLEVKPPPIGIKGVYQVKENDQPTRDFVFSTPNPQGNFFVIGRVDQSGNSLLDSIKGLNASDRDIDLRFYAGESSWALLRGPNVPTSRWIRVPYTAWQIAKTQAQQDRQVYTVITGQSQDTVWRATELLSRLYHGQPLKTFYPITIVVDSSSTGVAARYNDNIITSPDRGYVSVYLWIKSGTDLEDAVAVNKAYIADLDEDGLPAPSGTVVRFEKYKVIEEGDAKTIHIKPVETRNFAAAKNEIEKINVFPNPYYGVNRAELSRFRRYVTFNHLPAYAKIRIFNLAGTLVRTVIKQDDPNASTQFTNWDLNNETGLPVASGMYIAYLELKDANGNDLGTKTLKLMIVQEQQFLDNY